MSKKNPSTFTQELEEALASGRGPDLFMLTDDEILQQSERIITIPFNTVSARSFKDTFVEEGELFLNAEGILAFPFTIDPMIMYWNRDIFSRSGVAKPPAFWDELITLAPHILRCWPKVFFPINAHEFSLWNMSVLSISFACTTF